MASVYPEHPQNYSEIEAYVNRGVFRSDLFARGKCFFYDTCSFRYHAKLSFDEVQPILSYMKDEDGVVIVVQCVIMELASRTGVLNLECIQYFRTISESGLPIYVIKEESLFDIMGVCFGTNAAINSYLVWPVRMLRGPVSTITKTLEEDPSLYEEVIKGRNLDSRGIYERFFSAVRANKEPQDHLGEELLAICLHMLSQLPGEADGKFCVITDDKGAAGKMDELFEKTARQHCGKRIIMFSTPKLAQILYRKDYVKSREILLGILGAGGSGKIRVLGMQIYDLKSHELSLSREEAADGIMERSIHIIF